MYALKYNGERTYMHLIHNKHQTNYSKFIRTITMSLIINMKETQLYQTEMMSVRDLKVDLGFHASTETSLGWQWTQGIQEQSHQRSIKPVACCLVSFLLKRLFCKHITLKTETSALYQSRRRRNTDQCQLVLTT